jgi:hypothetical protein
MQAGDGQCNPAAAGLNVEQVSHLRGCIARAFSPRVCLVLLRQTTIIIAALCICFRRVLLDLTQASASLPLPAPRGPTQPPSPAESFQLLRLTAIHRHPHIT